VWIGFISIGFSAALLVVTCLIWLKTAVWYSYTGTEFLRQIKINYPRVSWAGAQQIIDTLLLLPVSLWVFLIGGLFLATALRPISKRRTFPNYRFTVHQNVEAKGRSSSVWTS
jgi:hypothetical protein